MKSRFVHCEFFRLLSDQHIGKKGDFVALEVNMRPSGGISPTMMNYANSTDVYEIWADMIAHDETDKGNSASGFCVFTGRRNGRNYALSRDDLYRKYGDHIKEDAPVADALSNTMGNYMYMACFKTEEEIMEFVRTVFEESR